MQVLPEEFEIGLETFFTKGPGIFGRLRRSPEDFVVIERSKQFPRMEKGTVTVAQVTSVNWETNHLVRELSNQLRISRKRVMFAGTKDKRAKTSQIMSFYKVRPEVLEKISLKDVVISDVFVSDRMLKLGDLYGNHFEITIRDVADTVNSCSIDAIVSPIQKYGGFPNFFGVQRFGIIRPITHIVGKHLVEGDFEKAVMTYLTDVSCYEDEIAAHVRKQLLETLDMKQAFHSFPDQLQFEKVMAQSLYEHPDDFVGALKSLPTPLLTMFVYAYQSFLFNRMLSDRIKKQLPLHQAVEGDVVLPVENGEISLREVSVSSSNIDRVNEQLKRGRGFVSGVLIGSDTTYTKGVMGDIERAVISVEGVDQRDFIIPELPVASSYGTRRALLSPLSHFSYSIDTDDSNAEKKKVIVCFDLLKGCYATSFLRELMKSDDIRKY